MIDKFGVEKAIGISSVPSYNAELEEKGVSRIVWKDYGELGNFALDVVREIEKII